nr:glycosyltransferase family 4 protein [Ignavibacteria bacterium]
EPARLIAALDILSFPSHNESFGLVLIEAMALNVPAAASGKSGVLDIVTDNETGLLFEPRNAKSQAEAISRLINSSELRKTLAQVARKKVEANFDLDVMTSKLLEFYKL